MTEMPAPAATADTETTQGRRWPRYLLLASLALNLLFVGMIGSAFWRGGWGHDRGNPSNMIGYVMQMPAERRTQLMSLSKGLRAEARELRLQARQANADRLTLLRAETFDKVRYIEAQTRQIEAETKVRLLMRTVLADTAAIMTAEERRAFVRWRGPGRMRQDQADPEADGQQLKK
jgi:uncharacterized membrane protein